jgi:DNA repair exonuclease SbcCD ATPase subunit
MNSIRIYLLISILALPIYLGGQQNGNYPEELTSGSLDSQLDYIFKNSGNYTNNGIRFKVSRTREFEKLWANISDSIKAFRSDVQSLKETISSYNEKIKDQQQKLDDVTTSLTQVTNEKDNISFLGNNISKMTYSTIIWTLFTILLLLLADFIYRYSKSNALTKEAKSKLLDLEEEYEEYRRKALEREQRISRQLHDEMNKNRKSK